ncbi:S1/P1 nuclease [Temperatibacter marinus]|uniref:S1/P1 nuclease n=1 Tax=Temperatibacter marinus TaxID=1456591 RepID=A0AA52EJF7_9PROT|nr:S1/P1 nuclease [Temperatibacter marinus]WND03910.1 S1/P1 nuclease [Temperatibacter marinus]
MKTILVFVATLVLTFNVQAWGQNGHRITGAIAEMYLSEEAKAAIKEILGGESLAEASTWADFMRSSKEDFWKKSGPYHYVTVPKGKVYLNVGAPERGDSVTALKMFSAVLTSEKTALADKQRALRFIVHIIGDLHQPLHAGDGTDRGGNDFKVKYFGQDSNLHRVWDTQMIQGQNLSYRDYVEFLKNDYTEADVKRWSVTDPKVWIGESTKIRDTIYPESTNLWYSYAYKHRATMNKRLTMGGVRIAAYLNELFA